MIFPVIESTSIKLYLFPISMAEEYTIIKRIENTQYTKMESSLPFAMLYLLENFNLF
jgi:hypothetical protein